MAMNKAEKAKMEMLEREVLMQSLMVLKPPLMPDIPAPKYGEPRTEGYSFNSYRFSVEKSWSTCVIHLIGGDPDDRKYTWNQKPIALYSTPAMAYDAMVRVAIRRLANALADEHLKIKAEVENA